MCKNVWLRAVGVGALLFSMVGHAADLRFGVNAPRGPLEAKKWEALAEYMSAAAGKPIELVPLLAEKIEDAVATGDVDFALVNPVLAVVVIKKAGAKPLATMSTNGATKFAGVIISKSGSGINKATDLKGKRVMGYQFGVSGGAWLFQTNHVLQAGVKSSEFASFIESKKQDDIPLSVKAGVVDVGFIRSGVLEAMQKEGKVSVSDFTIVDEKKDDLKLVHSTDLYPEWFMLSSKKTPDDISEKVKAALLALKPDDAAAKNAKIDGFVASISLDKLEVALKALKAAPFDN